MAFCTQNKQGRSRFAFLTLPNYSMTALTNAIEPLWMANNTTRESTYEWSIVSESGQAETACNGLQMTPTLPLDRLEMPDVLFVCGGLRVQSELAQSVVRGLKLLAGRGVAIGGICAGGYALAQAGLLDHHEATIDSREPSLLREQFPRISVSGRRFTIDRDRLTCSDSAASFDLILQLIEEESGSRVAQEICEQSAVNSFRGVREHRYTVLKSPSGIRNKILRRVTQVMEENIDRPIPLHVIASEAGISQRQIERLFKHHLDCSPKRYYLHLRLRRGRELLMQTSMSIMDIMSACGFQSPPHFSRVYRTEFGRPPSTDRDLVMVG